MPVLGQAAVRSHPVTGRKLVGLHWPKGRTIPPSQGPGKAELPATGVKEADMAASHKASLLPGYHDNQQSSFWEWDKGAESFWRTQGQVSSDLQGDTQQWAL